MSAKKQETVWQFPDVRSWCGIVFADYGNPLYYAQHLYVGDKEVTDLTIPDDVTTINGRAFNGFAALKSVHIGKGVKTIGSYAFAWCSSLTSIILPDNIESMGSYVFTEDTCLSSVALSKNCQTTENRTFEKCKALQTIVIPDGVKNIKNGAFEGCNGLKRIYMAATVETLGASAFERCGNLTDVYCYGVNPPTQEGWYKKDILEVFLNSYVDYSTVHVPETALDSYQRIHPWSDFGNIVALTNDETAITPVTAKSSAMRYVTLNGRQNVLLQKGINIVRQSDGTVRKLLKK